MSLPCQAFVDDMTNLEDKDKFKTDILANMLKVCPKRCSTDLLCLEKCATEAKGCTTCLVGGDGADILTTCAKVQVKKDSKKELSTGAIVGVVIGSVAVVVVLSLIVARACQTDRPRNGPLSTPYSVELSSPASRR